MNTFVAFGVSSMCVVLEDFRLKSTDVEKRVDGEDLTSSTSTTISMITMQMALTPQMLKCDGESAVKSPDIMDCTLTAFEAGAECW